LRGRYEEFRGRGVEILALAPGSVEETQAFAVARDLPFPCLADPAREVFRAYDVESRLLSLGQRPALYAVDLEGIVRYAFLGTQQWQVGDADEALLALRLDREQSNDREERSS
jgi:peroxiredoxin